MTIVIDVEAAQLISLIPSALKYKYGHSPQLPMLLSPTYASLLQPTTIRRFITFY